MFVLGIETSFDETCAAILKITQSKSTVRRKKTRVEVLSNIISSQIVKHKKFGGVVPQLAAGLHQKNIVKVLDKAFKKAKTRPSKIDLIAVTAGPGIIPALLVGVSAAKTLAWKWQKPIVGVNHMEGHVLSALISGKNFQFSIFNFQLPALALLVSGGHTQLVLMPACGGSASGGKYKILGETRDDAAGEAFDKVGKMLGLGYPAGAKIEQLAKKGNPDTFNFPRPMMTSKNYDFSFSGLKTAVLNQLKTLDKKSPGYIADIAASFQAAVIEVLVVKTIRAAKEFGAKMVIIGGGVSANQTLCNKLKKCLSKTLPSAVFLAPRKEYTGDNAVMIALAGYFRYKNSRFRSIELTTSRSGQVGKWEKVQADANLELK